MEARAKTPTSFGGSVPRDYETFLGPFLFEAYAADLASRLVVGPGGRVLETACGTGIATEHLRRSLDRTTAIVATDLSEDMLTVARALRGDLAEVEFEAADAAVLPYGDAAFDALCSQFGLMFVPDKARAMAEATRVLKPGGQLVLNVWSHLEANPFVELVQETLAPFFDSDPPQFLYKPWGYPDPEPIRALLEAAGFEDIQMEVVARTAEVRPQDAAAGLVRGNPTIVEIEQRAQASCDEILAAVTEALGARFGRSPARIPMQALVVTASKPA